jgi:hypothetical protein
MFSTSNTRHNDDTEATPRGARRLLLGLGTTTAVIAAVLFAPLAAQADPGDDDFLGVVEDYAIIASDTITETPIHLTIVDGNVALTTGTDQQLLDAQVDGDINVGNTASNTADTDLNAAYVILANADMTDVIVATVNLADRVTPYGAGVYFSGSDLLLDGEMFLDGGADDVFIFQASTGSLTVMAGSAVRLLGAVQACNVYWQVGSSATLGVDSEFVGSLLAATSIAAQNGAEITGQLLAGATNAGAVTLDNNIINAQSGCVRATQAEREAAEAAATGGTGGTGATGGTGGTGGPTASTPGSSRGTVLGSRVVAGGIPVVTGPSALADTGADYSTDISPMITLALLLGVGGLGAVAFARTRRTELNR